MTIGYEAHTVEPNCTIDIGLFSEEMYLPPAIVPPFVRKIGSLASEVGFGSAVVDVFADANIHTVVDGDTPPVSGQGLIIVGDHSRRIEPLLIQAAMGIMGREASRVIAMPISFAGRLMQSTEAGKDLIIPVLPTYWSAERRIPFSNPRDMVRRAMHPSVLNRPNSDLQMLNDRATTRAALHAASGEAVTIFPTGGSIDGQWYRGVGHIVNKLPKEARANTQIVGIQPREFSAKRVLGSLLLHDFGAGPKEQSIVLEMRNLGSAESFCDHDDAPSITIALREQFRSQFSI